MSINYIIVALFGRVAYGIILFDRTYKFSRFNCEDGMMVAMCKLMLVFGDTLIKPTTLVTGTFAAVAAGSVIAVKSTIASPPAVIAEASDTLIAFLGTIW